MATGTTTLTNRHFTLYKQEVRKLIARLGLTNWDVTFELTKLDGDYAYTYLRWNARKAHYRLNRHYPAIFGMSLTDHLKATAKHEVVHHLLAPITCVAESRWSTSATLDAAEHEVVGTLLRLPM